MDLAELYGVEPKVLVQAVKRNIERFPDDFIFQLSLQEVRNLKSHFVTSSWGGIRRAALIASDNSLTQRPGLRAAVFFTLSPLLQLDESPTAGV